MHFCVKPTNTKVPRIGHFSQHPILSSFSFAQCIKRRDTGAELFSSLTFLLLLLQTASFPLLLTDLLTQTSWVRDMLKAVGLYSHKHKAFSDHNVRLNFTSTETKWASSVLNCSSCLCGHRSFEKWAVYMHLYYMQSIGVNWSLLVFKSAPLLSHEEGSRILNNWSKTPLHWAGASAVAVLEHYFYFWLLSSSFFS